MIVRRTEIAIYADKKHGLEMPQLADVPQPSAELQERFRALAEGRGKQGFSLAGRAEASIWIICFIDGLNALFIFNRLMRFSVPCVLFSGVFFFLVKHGHELGVCSAKAADVTTPYLRHC